MPSRPALCFLALLAAAGGLAAQPASTPPPAQPGAAPAAEPEDPTLVLREMQVRAYVRPEDQVANFSVQSPRLAYFDHQPLPNGGLIYALEFIDRYRRAAVPDDGKWAGIIYFPWFDGRERPRMQWLVLYRYNGQIFGYDSTTGSEGDRRFAAPVRPGQVGEPGALFAVAEAFVEAVAPADTQTVELPVADENGDFTGETETECFDLEPGRIEGFLPSEQGLPPEQLVKLVYEFREEPNEKRADEPLMGRAPRVRQAFKWSDFFAPLSSGDDYLERAARLLHPRISQRVVLTYRSDVLFFKNIRSRVTLLLFQIGERVYAYYPDYGVWRTEATLREITTLPPTELAAKITYLTGTRPEKLEFLPWPKPEVASAPGGE